MCRIVESGNWCTLSGCILSSILLKISNLECETIHYADCRSYLSLNSSEYQKCKQRLKKWIIFIRYSIQNWGKLRHILQNSYLVFERCHFKKLKIRTRDEMQFVLINQLNGSSTLLENKASIYTSRFHLRVNFFQFLCWWCF